MLEASVTNGGRDNTTPPSYGSQTGPQVGKNHIAVDWWYVRLECPDGRVIELGYDRDSAYEVAKSFRSTKVKASVICKKVKVLR